MISVLSLTKEEEMRRKIMRKKLTVFILLIVSILIFAGCSSGSSTDGTKNNNNGNENNGQAEDGHIFEVDADLEGDITFWTWTPDIYEEVIEGFNKDYPNINVDVVGLELGELHDKLQTTLAAG